MTHLEELIELCRLKIQHYYDRQNILSILASAGYAVRVEEENVPSYSSNIIYTVVVYERRDTNEPST